MYAYIVILLASIIGIAMIDHRLKLALFVETRRTIITLLIGVIFFTLWDVLGIALGIFFSGGSQFSTNIFIFPEYPVEEFFFLLLLCYVTLVGWRAGERRWS